MSLCFQVPRENSVEFFNLLLCFHKPCFHIFKNVCEKEEQEHGKVKSLTDHQIRRVESPETTHKCKYIELSPPSIHNLLFKCLLHYSLLTFNRRRWVLPVHCWEALPMWNADFFTPLPFDSLSTHSTILKSIRCSWYDFKIHTDISIMRMEYVTHWQYSGKIWSRLA